MLEIRSLEVQGNSEGGWSDWKLEIKLGAESRTGTGDKVKSGTRPRAGRLGRVMNQILGL